MIISSKELMKRTGISYRQLDHWCRVGIIFPSGEPCPGSGVRRMFDEDILDRVKFLTKVSSLFCNSFLRDTLKKIYEEYDEKFLDLGDGAILSWGIDD